ncbi:hypothetical protein Cflav_PD0855 [Pedosphaera parvula Ellin514]|uniref:Uncharacterized protein n=1 Tax=Pedosphaera parvula (strain Ellin514) TaxID=320771 RepID=B9XQI0_PEDPL|nr:hypothetical protein Cflav_PD0855 [Pedosphaera parvula Ellin514]
MLVNTISPPVHPSNRSPSPFGMPGTENALPSDRAWCPRRNVPSGRTSDAEMQTTSARPSAQVSAIQFHRLARFPKPNSYVPLPSSPNHPHPIVLGITNKIRPSLSAKTPCGLASWHFPNSPSGPSPRSPVPVTRKIFPLFASIIRIA